MIRPRAARAARFAALILVAFHGALLVHPFAPPAFGEETSHRLPGDVAPTFQSVRLDLDADKTNYTGSTRIEIVVRREAPAIRFHAVEMELKRISLHGPRGDVALAPESVGGGIVAAKAPSPIAPGAYTLTIDFANDFDTRAAGLYRLESEGHAYAFTQFEATDARKAFPCWDEPAYKFPYQMTIAVPEAHRAVSNTPVEKETVEKGVRTVVFAKTKPLPSYLLAIATGPLEFTPIPGLRVPGRVVTPKGASGLTGPAVAMTPVIFDAVEKYFGIPYPYEKLDLIAVPEFSPGAMENAGAITYGDRFLLFDEKTMSATERRTLAVFTAHEIAHMWFGDLVTMKWWNDLWLNESFAEWLGDKIADQVQPESMIRLQALTEVQTAFVSDAQVSTHAIRQPVLNIESLYQAADELAYKKGQAVLAMTERWLGPETFRKGVLAYLKKHAWGNAEGKDLFDALGAASGQDVGGMLATFLDQPGVPVVHAELGAGGALTLTQARFRNFGVTVPPAIWKIPVTLKWEEAGKTHTKTVLLDRERMTVRLEGKAPDWVHPNADEAGYYRWSVDPQSLSRLIAAAPTALNERERIGLIQNATALLDAGELHGDRYVALLAAFSGEKNPIVLTALSGAMGRILNTFITPATEDAFAATLRRVLGPALRRYGIDRASGEPEAVSLVRPQLLGWLANEGKDEAALSHAEQLARAFLKDRASVDPSLVGTVLRLAAHRGDLSLFEEYRQRFESTTVPSDRNHFLSALGSFREPSLRERALRYALSGPLRPHELFWIPMAMAQDLRYQDQVWAWWQTNYDAVASRMPPDYVVYIPYAAAGCSEERGRQAEAFFADSKHSPPGTLKELARVLEGVRDCAGLRTREGEAVARALTELAQAK
jgi:alanyl aminopeptidase